MKYKFKLNLGRGLALTAVVLSLASLNSFALTSATQTNLAATARSPLAPATKMTAPGLSKAAPATTPSVMTEDIRDIRGPKALPSSWLWPLWLAGGAALAALLYAGWLWNRRRALAAALLPYEIALARLEEARALMQPENAREFSIAVSEIVRHYIEQRFRVWAARRTTEEFLHDLLEPSDALLKSHRGLLAEFLRHCDLAKFARWILSSEEMDTMLESAGRFVRETGQPIESIQNSPAQTVGTPSLPATGDARLDAPVSLSMAHDSHQLAEALPLDRRLL
jgi:hypothetical protein